MTGATGLDAGVDAGRARAWAWAAHLREGGTTPWAGFGAGIVGAEAGGRFLPGAQQLELLRRVNLAGGPAGRPAARLVERILTASAPGRGRPDLELVGVDERRRFGPLPVDPVTLPDHELLRVATGLLAEDLVAAGAPVRGEVPGRRVRVRYELAGDPWRAAPLTTELTSRGRPPGGAGRAVLVLGGDVPTMLAHAWAARCFAEGAPPWPEFVTRVHARGALPRRVDLVAVAERQLARPHTGRVSVVLDPAALPRLTGVRRLPPVPDVSGPAAELARLTGLATSLLVTPPEQAALLDGVLRPRLAALGGPLPAVPPEHEEWVEEAAHAVRHRLLRAGYPVVGDPDAVLPGGAASPVDRGDRHPARVATRAERQDREAGPVLDLAIGLLKGAGTT